MIVKMMCPQCEAPLSGDENSEFFECPYCGSKVMNVAQKVKVEQHIYVEHKYEQPTPKTEEQKPAPKRRSDGATLVVDYETINPGVNLVTRLANTRERELLTNGQVRKYNLPPGTYTIVLKIGKINHNKTFTIPQTKEAVYIHAYWIGRPNIIVDQPYYDEITPTPAQAQAQNSQPQQAQQQPQQQPKPVQPPKPRKPWEERSYFERVFSKESLAPWIISGALLLIMLFAFLFSPLAGILFLLAAIVINPLVTELVAMKFFGLIYHKPSKIGCYVLGCLLAIVAMIVGGKSMYKEAYAMMLNSYASTSTTTTVPSLSNKTQKDGFDETSEITVGNYVFTVPTYWEASISEKNQYKAYAEKEYGKEAILEIKAITDSEDPVNFSILKQETDEGRMMESIKANYRYPSNEKTELFENDVVKGYVYSLDYDDIHDGSASVFCFPSEEDNKWFYVTLTQTEDTDFGYDEDYKKILNSIKESKN